MILLADGHDLEPSHSGLGGHPFRWRFGGRVIRHNRPKLTATNLVMDQALGGGVAQSLAPDAHGKSLSSALLDLDIAPAPDHK